MFSFNKKRVDDSIVSPEIARREEDQVKIKQQVKADLEAYRDSHRGRMETLADVKAQRQAIREKHDIRVERASLRKERFREDHNLIVSGLDMFRRARERVAEKQRQGGGIFGGKVRSRLMMGQKDQRINLSLGKREGGLFGDVSEPGWMEERPRGTDHLFGKKKGGML